MRRPPPRRLRGLRADPADIIITNGIQQAIDLIGRVMLDQGACAAVEDPGYPPPRRLLESLGARVVAVPVDQEGLVVDALPDDARLVYCSPSHQFPLGMAMSLGRRIPLLAWAAQKGAAIIEDDYDSEFAFAGHPIEPLHRLDRDGRVIYLGSFSKSLLPPCGWASWWRRRRCAGRCARPSSSATGTPRCPRRRRWRASSTKASSPRHVRKMQRLPGALPAHHRGTGRD
jgi:DNA-binding transcriptional MocR family regulator